MPKRLIALSLAAAVLAGSGAAIAAAPVPTIAPLASPALAAPVLPKSVPAETVVVRDSLRLEARTLAPSYESGEIAIIEATATNTGSDTLEYWLPTPCHSPFTVTLSTPTGQTIRLPRESELGKEPMACIQVIKPLRLAPGAAVSERFAWQTAEGQPAGTYSVSVSFSPHSESGAPTAAVEAPVTIVPKAMSLTDIEGHWAAEQIRQALRAGFVNGYPGGLFKPDGQVTRAEFIKMLTAARGLALLKPGLQSSASPAFADARGHWVEEQGYLEAAVEAGFLHPEDYAGLLTPDQPLSREEAATMVVRAMAQERRALSINPDLLSFADKVQIDAAAAGYIMTASVEGVITGYENNTFRPDRPVTRAEAVTMLLRMQDAIAVRLVPDAKLTVGDQSVAITAGRAERHDRYLAPLEQLARVTGVTVAEGKNGWLMLSLGEKQAWIKVGVPYLIQGGGEKQPLDVTPPVAIDGQVYVPEAVWLSLGLNGHWDDEAKGFRFRP